MSENLPDTNVGNIEYIRKQDPVDALDRIFDNVPMELTTEILQLRRELRGLSPADVVPVVRCKECKFRENDDFCTGRGFPCQLVPDDGFCDKGERKERA